jgi:hypothetical protein
VLQLQFLALAAHQQHHCSQQQHLDASSGIRSRLYM